MKYKIFGAMKLAPLLRYVILSALLSACGEDARVASLEKKVDELSFKVDGIEWDLRILEGKFAADKVAFLTPGSGGYETFESDFGYLAVSLVGVEPHASGSKITLNFGNLTNARIDGLTANFEWGVTDANGVPQTHPSKKRKLSISVSLLAGAWNRAEVVLDGVPPVDLGFVNIRNVTHKGVGLIRAENGAR